MTMPLEKNIRDALCRVKIPGGGETIVSLGVLNGLKVKTSPGGAEVSFVLEINPKDAERMEALRLEAEKTVREVEGVAKVTAVLTAHRAARKADVIHAPEEKILAGVKKIIAIASGKGGVGKSTTAVNLAVALGMNGLRVGLLDADIYGPSVPRMMGIDEEPRLDDDDKLLPFQKYGIAVMSIGNLIEEDAPVIWRGPMVHGALRQLLADVAWGELDILIIDMPPGTGDAPLTLAHLVPLAGVVIVSTPQDVALLDARKAIGMFQKLGVPVLGIVENMSAFVCTHCGERSDIFGNGGARKEAERLGVPLLAEVPLNVSLRVTSDEGTPIVVKEPGSDEALLFRQMAGVIEGAVVGI